MQVIFPEAMFTVNPVIINSSLLFIIDFKDVYKAWKQDKTFAVKIQIKANTQILQ